LPPYGKNDAMVSQYYANGKILLSGEYLVLNGARALVLPLKLGQHMQVSSFESVFPMIRWQADSLNETWFSADIDIKEWNIISSTDNEVALKICEVLRIAGSMNHSLYSPDMSYEITTGTDFRMEWGLGSSSALVANVANWASIDPFELLFRTMGGSGADVAAAISKGPVLYRLNQGKPYYCLVRFKPGFYEKIWLVYLGNKQNTIRSVSEYKMAAIVTPKTIESIDDITLKMIESDNIESFMRLMHEHEKILSEVLKKPAIKDLLFSDFPGEIKSLGAWGGDFIMAVTPEDGVFVKSYFEKKGMNPVFPFENMILQ
jgi:mevalonate kinase